MHDPRLLSTAGEHIVPRKATPIQHGTRIPFLALQSLRWPSALARNTAATIYVDTKPSKLFFSPSSASALGKAIDATLNAHFPFDQPEDGETLENLEKPPGQQSREFAISYISDIFTALGYWSRTEN